jgi:hypothetical protein
LVLAVGRIRVLRDMLAKFGEMGPKPTSASEAGIRDAEPEKMLREAAQLLRRSGAFDRKADDRVLFAAQPDEPILIEMKRRGERQLPGRPRQFDPASTNGRFRRAP